MVTELCLPYCRLVVQYELAVVTVGSVSLHQEENGEVVYGFKCVGVNRWLSKEFRIEPQDCGAGYND